MGDYTELQAELEAKKAAGWKFTDGLDIDTVLALIAENERLQEAHEQICTSYNQVSYASEERGKQMDQLKAELEHTGYDHDLLRSERAQLKAENAGLRTGYEAYEQVNAELKAESERLERNRDMWKGQVDRQCETIEGLRKALKTAEDAMWHADGNMDGEAADARDALAALGQGEQS